MWNHHLNVLLFSIIKFSAVGAFVGVTTPQGVERGVISSSVWSKVSTHSDNDDDNYLLSRREAWETSKTAAVAVGSASGLLLPNQRAAAAGGVDGSPTTSSILVPKVRLGKSSLEVSRTIQGHWQLAGGHGRYTESDAISNMQAHYNSGITTLDTADIYGPSELIVGKFLKTQPQATVCTKFCCFRFLEDIDREEVRQRIQRACERLQVSKLPLVQYFWSDYSIRKYVDVALWLTELKEEGIIQEIGATNFDLKRLKELKQADVPIVSHQVQFSALDRRPMQSGMVDWCSENNISLITYGTVGGGILSGRYLGKNSPTKEEQKTASMRMYTKTADRFGNWDLVQELLQTMDAVSKQIQSDGRCSTATIANVAQRYVLQTPAVASIAIGVRNQDNLLENVQTHSFELTQAEIDAIDKVVAKRSGPTGDVWDLERGLIEDMKTKDK